MFLRVSAFGPPDLHLSFSMAADALQLRLAVVGMHIGK
jgi:hypothetical protein